MKLDPKRRKKAEAFIISFLNSIDPSGLNAQMMSEAFKTMSDDEFNKLRDGVPVYQPNGGKTKVTFDSCKKTAKKLGVELEQKLWLTEPKTGLKYLTKYSHKIFYLPLRRNTQMLEAKISVAKNDKVRDKLTGQVTGDSAAGGVSFPELYNMFSDNKDNSIREFIHARGGNDALNRAFYQSLRTTGKGSIDIPGAEKTSAKSTRTLNAYFKAMHIGSNIGNPS